MEYRPVVFPGANKSLERIPARSFVRISSGQNIDIGGSDFRVVNGYKPDGSSSEYWVTGEGWVAEADGSQMVLQIPVTPVWVRFASAPSGETCGPVDNEWTASDSGTGFRILYYDDSSELGLVIKEGGSGIPIVRFAYSASNGNASAICEIRSRPYGATVPDTILDGSAIIVHDPSGCYFNNPEVEVLTGRFGFAVYMDDTETMPDQDYPAPHWEVFSMCCSDARCSE